MGFCGWVGACEGVPSGPAGDEVSDVVTEVPRAPEDPGATLGAACGAADARVPGFLVADAQGGAVRSYGADGTFRGAFGQDQLEEPTDVTWGPEGDLYVADFAASAVFRFDAVTGEARGIAYLDRQVLEEPMAIRGTDDVLLTLGNDTSNVAVTRPDGGLAFSFGDPSLLWPLAMDVDREHRWVYVGRSGTEGPRIERYSMDGGPRSTAFGADLGLGPVRGVARGCGDSLYATDGDALLRFDVRPDGGAEVVKHWSVRDAARMRLGPDGRLYVVAGSDLLRLDHDDALRVAIRFDEEVEPRGVEFAGPPQKPGFEG